MKHHKALRILAALQYGFSFKHHEYEYFLGTNNALGVKMSREVDGVLIEDNDSLHGVEWSLKDFLNVCDRMTVEEVDGYCHSYEQEMKRQKEVVHEESSTKPKEVIYSVRMHEYLFNVPKVLGTRVTMMNNLVQNDMNTTSTSVLKWYEASRKNVLSILTYMEDVIDYIKFGKEPRQLDEFKVSRSYVDRLCDDDIPF